MSAQGHQSSLLMQAAQSAAQADGLVPSGAESAAALQQARNAIAAAASARNSMAAPAKKKGPPLRRGKWTPEEEAYANRLIQEFKSGLLPLTDGTTLRTFLSKLLNCDPMRISKKFVGSNCIGKQVFRRRNADLSRLTPEQIQQSRAELSELERRFLERVQQTNRVKSSSAGVPGAANAAAAAAAAASVLNQNVGENNHTGYGGETACPPWLQPPNGYKNGMGAAFVAANMSANSRAAAAGRALLEGAGGNSNAALREALERKSSGMDLLAEMQKRQSNQGLLNNSGSANNMLAAAARSGSHGGLSNNALSQLAQSASGKSLHVHTLHISSFYI
jgi:hypothetical protein